MSRLLIACVLIPTLLLGCADAKVDAKADTDINTQVESLLKAHLESLVKAQVDAKLQGIGDVNAKLAEEIKTELKAEIKTELETKIQAAVANNTQNTGMFAGGAIYVVILAIVFLVLLFGSFIYVVRSLLRWKKVWHLVSQSIEESSNQEQIKSKFASSLESAGLKSLVDDNLKKRGMRRNQSS